MQKLPRLRTTPTAIATAHLQRGLVENQFVSYFQPIIELRTGQLSGFEILARWQHPMLGIVSPDEFIPLAEENGWIDELTYQILLSAFRASAVIPEPITLSINISPVQLRHLGLPALVRKAAEATGFDLRRLVVEVTESALIDNVGCALALTQELKSFGCKVSLDDFGTGYSSLLHLQSLPFDELKVDRSFVKTMMERRESRKIVAAVIGLGLSLGLRTVAEGIETQEQAEMMIWLGCELGQGYFYGPPEAASELGAVLSVNRKRLVTRNLSPWKRISDANLDIPPSQRLAQLQAVYDGAPVGLAFINQKLQYVNLNQKLADMNRAPLEEHLGNSVSEMIPDLFPQVEPYIRRALRGEVINEVEAALPDSGEICSVSFQPALDEAGEVVGVSVAVMDVTARKRAEEALRESEEYSRSIVDSGTQTRGVGNPAAGSFDKNSHATESVGPMKNYPIDQDWLTNVHPEELQQAVNSILKAGRSRFLMTSAESKRKRRRTMVVPETTDEAAV